MVARDDCGCVILSAAKSQWPLVSAEMGEVVMAAEWAVRLALEHHWSNIIVEGDATLVIDALKKQRKEDSIRNFS